MKGSTGNSVAQLFALGPQHWARVVPHTVSAAKKKCFYPELNLLKHCCGSTRKGEQNLHSPLC